MLLSDLAKDAALSRDAFVKRHPEPILVSWSADDDDSPGGFHTPDSGTAIGAFTVRADERRASDQTPRDNGTPIPGDLDTDDTEALPAPRHPSLLAAMGGGTATAIARPQMDLVCLPLAKSDRNPFTQMVTAGRTPNNDLVLRDSTVSKFHAYFTQRARVWWLHDQNSTNGTYVARKKIDSKGLALSNGVRVSFGNRLSFKFFTPEGLHDLLSLR